MRKVTGREKILIITAGLIAVAIFAFIFLPMLRGKQPGSISRSMDSLDDMQERLEAMEKLENAQPLLLRLESRMREQVGYEGMSLKRGIAGSMIEGYLARAAAEAEIKDLEQLYAKLDTSKQTQTKADKNTLRPIADQLHLCQVIYEIEQEEKNPVENSEESVTENPGSEHGSEQMEEEPGELDKPSTQAKAPAEQAESKNLIFPAVPRDIPASVKRSLVRFIEADPGNMIVISDIEAIMDDAGLEDEVERGHVRKRLQLYSDRVKEVKYDELLPWLNKLGILQDAHKSQRLGRFTVKMVFKSRIESIVKFLYNLQSSAKWIKIESMRLSISNQKETVLSVELSMTATALYDL